MLIIKASYGDVRRRFVVDSSVSWDELSVKIREAFNLSQVWVRYRDSDNDLVTVASDGHLRVAVSSCAMTANMYMLTFEVSPPHTKEMKAPPTEHGVQCKGCQSWIRGVRYRCGMCDDFDLCDGCESVVVHDESHVFVKLRKMVSCKSGPLLLANFVPITAIPRDCAHAWQLQQQASLASATLEQADIASRTRTDALPQRPRSHSVGDGVSASSDVKAYLARFVRDVACADGTVVEPNARFVKVWRMENNGIESWPRGTRLVSAGGNSMGGVTELAIAPTKPGEERDLAIELVAPAEEGRHVGYWRLSLPDGTRFGHRVWVDITVDLVASKKALPMKEQATAQTPRGYSPFSLVRSILGRVGVTGSTAPPATTTSTTAVTTTAATTTAMKSDLQGYPSSSASVVAGGHRRSASHSSAYGGISAASHDAQPMRRMSTPPLSAVPEREIDSRGKLPMHVTA
eukprot:Opistho-2@3360